MPARQPDPASSVVEDRVSVPPDASGEAAAARRARMHCVDTSDSENLPLLMEMIGAISRADDAQEVYRRFARGMRRLSGPIGYVSLSTRGLGPGEYKITRTVQSEREIDTSPDPWKNWDAMPVHRGGILGELIRQAYPELIHHADLSDDPVLGDAFARYRCVMAIPLFDDGEPLNWSIVLHEDPERFTVRDLEETLLRANLIGGMTKNTVISRQLREANERIVNQIEQIGTIQRTLLPEAMPEIDGVEFAASYKTSEKAGGDYYDFLPLQRDEEGRPRRDGRWGVIIADASGHGASAAVVMAMLHAILHAFPGPHEGPGRILEFANRHLCAKRLQGSFVTAFMGVLDPNARTLLYARAGHNPPLVKGAQGVRRLEGVGGLPLGIEPDVAYEDREESLAPGETVVLYTDGITEAAGVDGGMFGVKGIRDALSHCTGEPECVVGSINEALTAFQAGRKRADDQTLVALRLRS